MTQQLSVVFNLTQSGQKFKVPNGVMQSSGNLSITIAPNGSPSSLSVSVSGLSSPATASSDYGNQPGTESVLATYSNITTATTATTETLAITQLWDAFEFSCQFSGGNNVSVAVTVTGQGVGSQFSSENLNALQSYAT